MRLTDLEPRFYVYEQKLDTWNVIDGDHETWVERGRPTKPVTGMREYRRQVDTLQEAQSVQFVCPLCLQRNNGKRAGVHSVDVTFANRGVPDEVGCHDQNGKPTRWQVTGGTGFHDLTTMPSILLLSGCGWHGFITNGEVSII